MPHFHVGSEVHYCTLCLMVEWLWWQPLAQSLWQLYSLSSFLFIIVTCIILVMMHNSEECGDIILIIALTLDKWLSAQALIGKLFILFLERKLYQIIKLKQWKFGIYLPWPNWYLCTHNHTHLTSIILRTKWA